MRNLLLDDLQQLHGAGLDADAAGDALGSGGVLVLDDQAEGAGFRALAAAGAELLVDHVHAGLGILGNGLVLTGLHALTALDTDIGLCACTLCNDLNAGIVLMEFLIKCLGTSADTFQTSHAFDILLYCQFFHNKGFSFYVFILRHYNI